jgi:hypothetical protein
MSLSVTIDLSPAALRQAFDLLEQGPYDNLDALLEALVLETNGEAHASAAITLDDNVAALTRLPSTDANVELAAAPQPAGQLQFLTNRFGPLKVAVRVLANLALGAGSWPTVGAFQDTAANVAREVGLRLRAEDVKADRKGATRRWVAYPVGTDEARARERFIFSFTVAVADQVIGGPLAQLGCVAGDAAKIALTEAGWELAHAPSPTLDGTGEGTLSAEEMRILRARLLVLPGEADAIREFLRAVRRGGGTQGRVDELLTTWHSDWTGDRAAAERSAMLGRLGELGALYVVGRGPAARIELLETAGFEGEH